MIAKLLSFQRSRKISISKLWSRDNQFRMQYTQNLLWRGSRLISSALYKSESMENIVITPFYQTRDEIESTNMITVWQTCNVYFLYLLFWSIIFDSIRLFLLLWRDWFVNLYKHCVCRWATNRYIVRGSGWIMLLDVCSA